jgi:uncharacterized protein (TIGR02466 family)
MAPSNDLNIDESDVYSLFPTSVWKVQVASDVCNRLNSAVRASLEVLNPQFVELAAGESWQSDHQLHALAEYHELVSCIRHTTGTILQFLKVGVAEIELTGCWANVAARGASHPMHSHPNNFLSGVYYVQTSPGADTINFHDPRPQAVILKPPVTELTGQNVDPVVIKVTNGTLLMFPSYLTHSVSPSESNEQRISISFNLMFSAFAENLSQPMWDARLQEKMGS